MVDTTTLPRILIGRGKTSERPARAESRSAGFWDYETGLLYLPNESLDWIEIGAQIENNYVATANPTVTDDSASGYEIGSRWLNTTTNTMFICIDASVGTAIWYQIAIKHNLTATVPPTGTDDINSFYVPGSIWIDVNASFVYMCIDNTATFAYWIIVSAYTLDFIAQLGLTSGNTIRANGSAWIAVLNNFGATVAPTTGDDSADGYAVGSFWVNTTADVAYICLDASVGTAVWYVIGSSNINTFNALTHANYSTLMSNGTAWVLIKNNQTTTAPTVSDDNTQGYVIGSIWRNTTSKIVYMAMDISTGAAVWQIIGSTNLTSFDNLTHANYNTLRSNGTTWAIIKNNQTTTDPTVTDDSSANYSIGSVWRNTTSKRIFICIDTSVGSAVWQVVGSTNLTGFDNLVHANYSTLQSNGTSWALVKNIQTTANPTINDDSGDGYSINSVWINTTTDAYYVCLDATIGAAVWKDLSSATGILNNLIATSDPTSADDTTYGYSVGSTWINSTNNSIWMLADDDVTDSIAVEYGVENWDSNVLLKTNSGAGGTVDTNPTVSSSLTLGDNAGNESDQAQTFIPTSGRITDFSWVFGATVGTPLGAVRWELRSTSPSGTILLQGGFLPTASTTNTITIDNGIFLDGATTYSVNLYAFDQNTNVRWTINSGANSYANGTAYQSLNGGAFSALASDADFQMTTVAQSTVDSFAQGFQIDNDRDINSVRLWMRKIGSPTANLTVTIETDNAGNPSGTPVTNGTANVVASSALLAQFSYIEFTFATPPSLTSGTQYHLVLTTAASASATNYVCWGTDQSSPGYANGELKQSVSSVWSSVSADAIFQIITDGVKWNNISETYISQGLLFKDPNLQTWTAYNQGGDFTFTEDTENKRLTIHGEGSGSANRRGWTTSIPSAFTQYERYTITVYIESHFPHNVATFGTFIGWKESLSDRKLVWLNYSNGTTRLGLVTIYQNATDAGAAVGSGITSFDPVWRWRRLKVDGTNIEFQFSVDGVLWETYYNDNTLAIANSLWLAKYDQFIFGVISNAASTTYDVQASLLHYNIEYG